MDTYRCFLESLKYCPSSVSNDQQNRNRPQQVKRPCISTGVMITLIFVYLEIVKGVSGVVSTSNCRPTPGDNVGHNTWKTLLENKDYSAQRPPSFDEPHPDPVYIAIQILDIDEVNEQQMYYQIQLFIVSAWIDKRLEVKDMKNNTRILLPDDAFNCFWSPSLIFDNNKDGKHFSLSVPNTLMTVYSNRTVLKASRFSVKVRCRFDLSRYPMDVQRCQFRMRLFDESEELVKLRWIEDGGKNFTWITPLSVKYNRHIKPTQFKFEISKAWNLTKPWLNNNYTNIGVNITFTRLLTSSLLTIYIPSTIVVSLSWLSFWIDIHGIPGRISLGIMSVLTIITQILDIRKNMPPVSYVTAIDIWLFVCLIAVFLSLVEYAFAYNHVRKKLTEEAAKRLGEAEEEGDMKSVATVVNGISRIAWTPLQVKPQPREDNSQNTILKSVINALQLNKMEFSISRLDDYSKVVFPVLFFSFSCVYWIYYLVSDKGIGGVDEF